jgi:hypothetical protein
MCKYVGWLDDVKVQDEQKYAFVQSGNKLVFSKQSCVVMKKGNRIRFDRLILPCQKTQLFTCSFYNIDFISNIIDIVQADTGTLFLLAGDDLKTKLYIWNGFKFYEHQVFDVYISAKANFNSHCMIYILGKDCFQGILMLTGERWSIYRLNVQEKTPVTRILQPGLGVLIFLHEDPEEKTLLPVLDLDCKSNSQFNSNN